MRVIANYLHKYIDAKAVGKGLKIATFLTMIGVETNEIENGQATKKIKSQS